jgi:hypothetical protein
MFARIFMGSPRTNDEFRLTTYTIPYGRLGVMVRLQNTMRVEVVQSEKAQ